MELALIPELFQIPVEVYRREGGRFRRLRAAELIGPCECAAHVIGERKANAERLSLTAKGKITAAAAPAAGSTFSARSSAPRRRRRSGPGTPPRPTHTHTHTHTHTRLYRRRTPASIQHAGGPASWKRGPACNGGGGCGGDGRGGGGGRVVFDGAHYDALVPDPGPDR